MKVAENKFIAVKKENLNQLFMVGFLQIESEDESFNIYDQLDDGLLFLSNDENNEPIEHKEIDEYCYCGCGEVEGTLEFFSAKEIITLTPEQIEDRKIDISYQLDEVGCPEFIFSE
jgi:hypothetical protein